ncbi:MAG: terminase small subunit [Gemmatimonadota bacterium]
MVRRIANQLTAKEHRFVDAYVLEPGTIGNGAASARAAGYAPKHAARIAHKVLRRPLVQQEIAKVRRLRQLVRVLYSRGMLSLPPDIRP